MSNTISDADIQWGAVKESADKTKTYYKSFVSEGTEYHLFDNVQVYDESAVEPHVAKIMKLWEDNASSRKRVLVRWFFKPRELPHLEAQPKELFLAFGKGKGVTNENDLEVVCGKCRVLCVSKDPRNRQPSVDDLESADYFFSKIYNVDLGRLSPVQAVVEKIGLEAIYNKQGQVSEGEKAGDNSVLINDKSPSLSANKALPESKKRVRDADVQPDAQKRKLVQQGNKQLPAGTLKRSHVNDDDATKSKKLKSAVTAKSVSAKEASTKVVEGAGKGRKVTELEKAVSKGAKSTEELEKAAMSAELTEEPEKAVTSGAKLPEELEKAVTSGVKSTEELGKSKSSVTEEEGFIDLPLSGEDKTDLKDTSFPVSAEPGDEKKVSETRNETPVNASGNAENYSKKELEDGIIAKSEQKTVNASQSAEEAGSSEKRRLVKASESAKPVNVKNQDENRNKGGQTDLDNKSSKVLKKEKGKDETKSLLRQGDMSGKQESMIKDKKLKSATDVDAERDSIMDNDTGVKQGTVNKDKKLKGPTDVDEERDSSTGNDKQGVQSKDKKLKNAMDMDAERNALMSNDTGKTAASLSVRDKRRLFKKLPWEESLQQSIPAGKVLLFQNFDPFVTTTDVREMLGTVFEGFSDARVIPQETSCPSGQALVIFNSRTSANLALEEMEKKCLVTNDKRPLIARRVSEPDKSSRFPGDMQIEKIKLARSQLTEEYRIAVATSHSAQPNTVEFEMAVEWRHLQEIMRICWTELLKKQIAEIRELRKKAIKKN